METGWILILIPPERAAKRPLPPTFPCFHNLSLRFALSRTSQYKHHFLILALPFLQHWAKNSYIFIFVARWDNVKASWNSYEIYISAVVLWSHTHWVHGNVRLNGFLLQNTLSALQARSCFCVSLMIPWYWCEFGGVWRPKHQTSYFWWRKESFPSYYFCVSNSKGSVNCPVMQSENLGEQWDTCVTVVPLPPATTLPSLAWPEHLLWNDDYKLMLSFAFLRQQRVCYWDQSLWGKGHLPEYTRKFRLWVSTWLLTWSNWAELWRWVQHSAFHLAFSCFLNLLSYCHPRKDL